MAAGRELRRRRAPRSPPVNNRENTGDRWYRCGADSLSDRTRSALRRRRIGEAPEWTIAERERSSIGLVRCGTRGSFCGKVTADDRTKLETLSSLIGNTIAEFAALACRRIEFAVKIIIMIALQSNDTE